MATLSTALTLTSSDAGSDILSISVTEGLTIGEPFINMSRVATEVSGGSDIEIKPAGSAGNHYLYVKHTGLQGDGSTPATAAVILKLASTSLSVMVPGEWCFFNVINSGVINAASSGAETLLVEYGYWTKS
tara:strand:- start:689 stop:1081 length:393 start_codon:yes stop_codon:yes gene_type:complete